MSGRILHHQALSVYDGLMSQDWETMRERSLIDSYSIYESIGIAVQSAMFRRRLRNKDLAVVLGVTPSVAGRKLRGGVAWSVQDVFAAAQMLGVEPAQLLPQQIAAPTSQALDEIPELMAGAGFEPATIHGVKPVAARGFAAAAAPSCPQRGSNPRPMENKRQPWASRYPHPMTAGAWQSEHQGHGPIQRETYPRRLARPRRPLDHLAPGPRVAASYHPLQEAPHRVLRAA